MEPPPAPPADFDADTDTDIALYRPAGNAWFVQGGLATGWGAPGDIAVPPWCASPAWARSGSCWPGHPSNEPAPADYDGDGDSDVAVFRPADATCYVQGGIATQWGVPGDIVPGDYNGDGRAEVAVFRPSDATCYVQGGIATQWGKSGDVPVVVPYSIRQLYPGGSL